jgi:hypothetical protein
MSKDKSLNGKAVMTFANLGPKFDLTANASGSQAATLKVKMSKLSLSLVGTDKTFSTKSTKDVVATADLKFNKNITLTSAYDLGTKKYKAGTTVDYKLLSKPVTFKANYFQKDSSISGETTVAINKNWKTSCTWDSKKLLTAKYAITKGCNTFEPSYNFEKKSAALALTVKGGILVKADTCKLTYDLKSKNATIEYNKKPIKLVLSAPVAMGSKPKLTATFEPVYSF